jgi:hypothetical protein
MGPSIAVSYRQASVSWLFAGAPSRRNDVEKLEEKTRRIRHQEAPY